MLTRMHLSHRIRLVPTPEQEIYFVRACGVARFAYNWALARWKSQIRSKENLSEAALRKQLNAIKHDQFPWMSEVTKNAPQQAIKNLGRACAHFFDDLKKCRRNEIPWKRVRVPRFKKKGVRDAFRADNGPSARCPDAVRVNSKLILLPRIGWVRMREELRFAGRILSVTVSRDADAWYASVTVDTGYEPEAHASTNTIGVDLGCNSLATLNIGTTVPAPKPLRRMLNRLKRLSKSLSRKKRGSRNRAKAKTKLARLHARIANIRIDSLHKLTSMLVSSAKTIIIEDLEISGMLKNRRLSRTIADIGLFEFRRQLQYKAILAGSTVVLASRWYPSSKLCSACNEKNGGLKLSERTWTCGLCGTSHNRDINAAINLARYPESWPGSACGAEGAGAGRQSGTKPAA